MNGHGKSDSPAVRGASLSRPGPADPKAPVSPAPSTTAFPGEVPGAEIFHIGIRDLRSGNPDKDFHLEPGDTVYSPKTAQFDVSGFVNRPGAVRFEEGTTVYQALALEVGIME